MKILWTLLALASALHGAEFTDIDGISVITEGKNNLIIITTETCEPGKRLVTLISTNIALRYANDAQVVVLFPCGDPSKIQALRDYRAIIPGASNVCMVGIDIGSLFLTNWSNANYANPCSFIFNKSGTCTTNIPYYNPDWKTYGAALSREFLNLRMNRETMQPEWNLNTGLRWRAVIQHVDGSPGCGPSVFTHLEYP